MNFLLLAEEFAELTLFNHRTQQLAIQIAKLFVRRAGVSDSDDITTPTLVRFKSETLRSVKPVTYNAYLKYLRLIAEYGVEKTYLTANPFKQLPTAPLGIIPPKVMEFNDIEQLDCALMIESELHQTGWFWAAMIRCLYYTGMRRRQIVNLKLGDLDFQKQTIRLVYEGSKTQREWTIPMHAKLNETFLTLISKTELRMGKKLKLNDYLFRAFDLFAKFKADDQGRMTPESITGYFKRLSKKMHIRVGAHRFRHTLATALCNPEDESSPDLFAVQTLLGHANMNTTRMYVQTRVHSIGKILKTLSPLGQESTNTIKGLDNFNSNTRHSCIRALPREAP